MKYLLFFCFALLFSSCQEDQSPTRTDQNLSQSLVERSWLISVFEVEGVNRTGDFEGVNFNFLPSGQVEVFRGSQLLNEGTWSTTVEEGRVVLEFYFSEKSDYEGFNRKWYQTLLGFGRITFRVDDGLLEDRLILQSTY